MIGQRPLRQPRRSLDELPRPQMPLLFFIDLPLANNFPDHSISNEEIINVAAVKDS
jgi:hypothetical protein